MEAISVNEVLDALKGEVISSYFDENLMVHEIMTDSRKTFKNALFIPIKGDSFDGHNFIDDAINNGAVLCLTDRALANYRDNIIYIKVNDTRIALGDLARYYRKKFEVKIVGVTGSVGKTSTKDMLASVLDDGTGNVLKTEGNFNNDIGLPLTIFNLKREHKIAILEMGMSNRGEISYLSSIAEPDIAIITNIGTSHIEFLGSRENIYQAKMEILDSMKQDSLLIINSDDDFLSRYDNDYFKVKDFSINKKADVYATEIIEADIDKTMCMIHSTNDEFKVTIPTCGKHMVYTALIATIVGEYLGIPVKSIQKGIESFRTAKMRMDIIKKLNNIIIINDAYNANPQSMKAGIDVLASAKYQNKIAILGDMLELGSFSYEAHKEIGEYIVEKKIDVLIAIGENAKFIYQGAISHQNSQKLFYFFKKEEAYDILDNFLKPETVILVKGSRGMQLEEIVTYLSSL